MVVSVCLYRIALLIFIMFDGFAVASFTHCQDVSILSHHNRSFCDVACGTKINLQCAENGICVCPCVNNITTIYEPQTCVSADDLRKTSHRECQSLCEKHDSKAEICSENGLEVCACICKKTFTPTPAPLIVQKISFIAYLKQCILQLKGRIKQLGYKILFLFGTPIYKVEIECKSGEYC